jgi:hypothetical protein
MMFESYKFLSPALDQIYTNSTLPMESYISGEVFSDINSYLDFLYFIMILSVAILTINVWIIRQPTNSLLNTSKAMVYFMPIELCIENLRFKKLVDELAENLDY